MTSKRGASGINIQVKHHTKHAQVKYATIIKLLTSAVQNYSQEITGEYSCNVTNENCMNSVCPECPSLTITDSYFEDSPSSSSKSRIRLVLIAMKKMKF